MNIHPHRRLPADRQCFSAIAGARAVGLVGETAQKVEFAKGYFGRNPPEMGQFGNEVARIGTVAQEAPPARQCLWSTYFPPIANARALAELEETDDGLRVAPSMNVSTISARMRTLTGCSDFGWASTKPHKSTTRQFFRRLAHASPLLLACLASLTSCCSTSPQTISTLRRRSGLKSFSRDTPKAYY